jgi:hypothetical protein
MNRQTMDRVRETTHRAREHQTPGKIVGTKNDTPPIMGSHAKTMEVPERRLTRRQ